MSTYDRIVAADEDGDLAPAVLAKIVAAVSAPSGSTGVESVSGTVVLGGTGAPVREFWTTGAATIGGVSFAADTAVVFRRTAAGAWGYKVVDGWTAVPTGGGGDTTAPVAGTLASSAITATGFTLTVSGASDETALHSQPYAFSTDNGTTWSGWQSSSSLAVTGKTASTAYQCRHKVRDAAGNETTGTAITVTTSAPVGTLTYQGQQSATADVFGDYTYAAPIGAADTDREVIVALSWRASAGRDPSLTINGTAATLDYSTLTGNIGTKFYRASVPSGTTATVVSTSAASYWPTIAVWTTDAHVTFAAGGVTTVNSGATSATVGPVTAASPGFAISAFRSNSAATAVAWTGATERYDLGTAQPASGADTLTTGPVTLSAAFTPAITNDVKLAVSTYGWA